MSSKGKTGITELWPGEESKHLCTLCDIKNELHESMIREERTLILSSRTSLTEHRGSGGDGKSPLDYFRAIMAIGPPMDDDISR